MQTWVQIVTLIDWANHPFRGLRDALSPEKAAVIVKFESKRDLTHVSGVDGEDGDGTVARSIDRMIGELSGVTSDLNANAQSIDHETDHLSSVLDAVAQGFKER
jgi:methyl-accepting chemotaxis protein